jgi:hypothetical protein
MRLFAVIALVLWSVSAAAFDPARWTRVNGGTWIPSPTELRKLEDSLIPAVRSATQNMSRTPQWSEYAFQFQGRTAPRGQKFVFVNAFCHSDGGPLDVQWVTVDDGGPCYFSAKYDLENRRIRDLRINGVG